MGVYLSSKTEKGRDRKKGACPKKRVEFTPTCVTFCCSPPKLFIRTEKGSLLWAAEDRLGERTQNFIARREMFCKYSSWTWFSSDLPPITIALACHSVPVVKFCPNCWIHQNWYMYFLVVIWICQNWYMDFSKLVHGFLKIYTSLS